MSIAGGVVIRDGGAESGEDGPAVVVEVGDGVGVDVVVDGVVDEFVVVKEVEQRKRSLTLLLGLMSLRCTLRCLRVLVCVPRKRMLSVMLMMVCTVRLTCPLMPASSRSTLCGMEIT